MAGGGHLLDGRHPVAVNRWIRDFAASVTNTPTTTVRAAAATSARTWTRRWTGRGGCSTCPRRSASGTPAGTWRSSRSCARREPGVQVDWLAQHPVTAMLGGPWRTRTPGVGLAGQRVRALGERGRRPRPARVPGGPADGRDPGATTSWSSPTWSHDEPYDLWVGDEAWDVDYFLHENPELKRTAVRLADRLRRLAADARRRHRGGRADRRLQRRDGRADRPVPAAARPGAVRRRTRRRACPTPLGPGLPAIRDWTGRTSTSPATSPASTRPRSPTATRCEPSSAGATDERDRAWSPSAVRGSANRSCAG